MKKTIIGLGIGIGALAMAACGTAGTPTIAAPSSTQAPVTVTVPGTTQPPVTVTAPSAPTTSPAPRTTPPATTAPPATTVPPTLDSVVPRHAAHGTAADTVVDTLYVDEKYVVDLYIGAGSYVDATEAGQLNAAQDVVSTDLGQLSTHITNDAFSNAQLTAITNTCNAGTTLVNDMTNLKSNDTVSADWAAFDAGYQSYVAATN